MRPRLRLFFRLRFEFCALLPEVVLFEPDSGGDFEEGLWVGGDARGWWMEEHVQDDVASGVRHDGLLAALDDGHPDAEEEYYAWTDCQHTAIERP